MRALIQRVKSAQVRVNNTIVGEIGSGVLTLLGVGEADTEKQVEWMISKILKLRIFEDDQGKMNLSLLDLKKEHLIVSQFTLYGDCSKGNRPSFISAGKPEVAQKLYEKSVELSQFMGVKTQAGKFQAHMEVSLINDGPVTLWIESP